MQDNDFVSGTDQYTVILENDKKYLQEQNDKLNNQLNEVIEELTQYKMENKKINEDLNMEREKVEINKNYISQLTKETDKQDDDQKFEGLFTQKYQQKLKSIEQRLLEKYNQQKKEKERILNDNFKEFLEKLEQKWNVDKNKYFKKYKYKKQKLKEKMNELQEEIKQKNKELGKFNYQQFGEQSQIGVKNPETQRTLQNSTIENQKQQEQQNNQETQKRNQDKVDERLEESKRQARLAGFNETREQKVIREARENEERRNAFKQMFTQIRKSHGIIEICFLLDITGSMDPYKQQAKKCIQESIKQIKTIAQKETKWSVIGYQDFAELKQLGGQYRQLEFIQDSNSVESFLDTLVCAGGGDEAEDIRGGMKQMVKNLKWEKEFRLAILICDAPTHGSKYNGGVSDRYPNEDIKDAILELIEKNIFLMAIQFNKTTGLMLSEIKKIYQVQGKPELILIENAEDISISNLSNLFTNLISKATLTVTQMNNSASKIKNKQTFEKQEITGAMENLSKCKTDPVNFDQTPGIEVGDIQFEVFQVELSNESLEKHLLNIKDLTVENYFKPIKEPGVWDCKRTIEPFAKGSVKQVFLMKKKDTPTELYAIKMPKGSQTYKSIEQAIKDCRSHLIAKGLLDKFIKDLEKKQLENPTLNIPNIKYTNILILKDLKQKDSYWVAERYICGEFVKYNNNGAYILDDSSNSLNHLMQAFSLYTYFKSNFNYIICDVQSIGLYLTDPAINSKDGNFDETDMGQAGIDNYFGTYQGKKNIGREYLKCLKIGDFEAN